MSKKKPSPESIESKIKRLNELYVNNGDKEQIERLRAEIDFFFYGYFLPFGVRILLLTRTNV